MHSIDHEVLCGDSPRRPSRSPRFLRVVVRVVVVQCAITALGRTLHDTRTIAEARPEKDIGIRKQPLLQGHHDELRTLEPCTEQLADVLCMRQIEGGVDLIEDVHWCWLELQESHDER
jgi:hypothetical protein